MKLTVYLCSLFGLFAVAGQAQTKPDSSRLAGLTVEIGGAVTTPGITPFWLRTNQLGTVPLDGSFGFVRTSLHGQLGKSRNQKWVVRYGLDAVLNRGQKTDVLLPEAYLRVERGHLSLEAGRWRQVLGVADTTLSSGAYSWSGNALPLPRLQIGTKGFAPVGFTRGWLSINANLAHGWFGNTGVIQNSFLHQKAIYFKVGKPGRSVKFIGGITHVVQWGGRTTAPDIGVNGALPSSLLDYLYVFSAVTPPASFSSQISTHDQENRFGNHLGSVDFAMDIPLRRASLLAYVQRPYDDDTGVLFMNMPDGLYGIRWQNQSANPQTGFRMQRVTTEFLTTLNQSGFMLGGGHFQGADDYFNNFQFRDGWIYRSRIIGTPFFTRDADSRPEFYNLPGSFNRHLPITNNRVQVIHVGLQGGWSSGVRIRALLSQSWNYGRPMRPEPIVAYSQFSGLVELTAPVNWLDGLDVRATVAADRGQWLNNSVGAWVSLRKTGF